MRSIHLIFFSVLITLFSLSVAWAQHTNTQPIKWQNTVIGEWVAKARANTTQVSIADLKTLLDDDADIEVLDIRTPREYEVAHIPGATNISRGLLEFAIWSVFPDKEEKLYVYCKSGARAALATQMLNTLGYKNAVAVKTGITDWTRSGYPLQTSITDEQVVVLPID